MSVLTPEPECRMRSSGFGSTATGKLVAGIAFLLRAVDDRRDPARGAQAPRFVLAPRLIA